jgi:hypothetical protein
MLCSWEDKEIFHHVEAGAGGLGLREVQQSNKSCNKTKRHVPDVWWCDRQ